MAPTESGQPRLDDRLAQLLALSDRAYLLAVRMLGSREGAEDVVQQAYLGAVRALRGSAAPERPEAWFLGAVVHAARNYLRTENRRRRKEAVMIARQVAGGAERAAPEGSEMAAALRTAIAALDEKYRGPLCLCCEQGLSRREAAGILGLPERTVSKHVGEALERLKRALAAGGYAAATPAAVLAVLKVAGETVPVTLAGALQSLLSNAAALGAPGAAGAGATATVAKAAGLSLAWKLAAAASIAVIVGAGTVAGVRHFGAVAGADPALPGPSALPANAWVQAPDSDELKKLKELRAALSATHRPKGSDWLFVEGWPVYSAGGGGVWLPERKAAFFVTGNVYENPPCNAYLHDPAATGKVAKVAWGAASGWKRLDPGGDRISGTLRWASLGYDPVNREVLLCGGNSAERSGSPGTMTYDPGKNVWKRLDFSARPLFKVHADCEELRLAAQALEGRLRSRVHLAETAEEAKEDLAKLAKDLRARVADFAKGLPTDADSQDEVGWARPELDAGLAALDAVGAKADPAAISKAAEAAERLRAARDWLAVEPPPRANGAMACDPKAGKIVLFGGDHLDYLMSDTWAYDCKARRWKQLRPKLAPAPRGGHAMLYLPKSGALVMLGGYAYGSEEWPKPLYVPRDLELWACDLAGNEWSLVKSWPLVRDRDGKAQGVQAGPMAPVPAQPRTGVIEAVAGGDDVILCGQQACRVDAAARDAVGAAKAGVAPGAVARRGGQYAPAWQDQVPAPDEAANERFLKELPANAWVRLEPPRVFRDHRDWGTATYDSDRRQILWFSGGHCCYSGTDVSVYSTRAGTWRMSAVPEMPAEFISGTGYHNQQWSFELRPFMTSHTYKLYAYDPRIRKMLLYNRGDTFVFDPARCDWERERVPAPFGGGWWVPHFCTTPEGVVVWAPRNGGGRDAPGLLWRFNAEKRAWEEIKTAGGPLPGTPSDDWGTVVHDAKRKQLLLFSFAGDPRGGKAPSSVVWSCDLATGALRKLEPANARQGAKFPREAVYLPAADLVLFADLRKDLGAGRIAATVYDVEGNRFRGLEMALPAGKGKPAYGDVGCGLMYDPGRELVWAVYPFWDLQVMRFDPKTAKLTDD